MGADAFCVFRDIDTSWHGKTGADDASSKQKTCVVVDARHEGYTLERALNTVSATTFV